MPVDYGAPQCPNSLRSSRLPGQEPCPRSDTYRAIESGNNNAIWGWLFRCRTCGTMFFRASREMGQEGLRLGRLDKLAQQAQKERR